jgi:hypothetical protein
VSRGIIHAKCFKCIISDTNYQNICPVMTHTLRPSSLEKSSFMVNQLPHLKFISANCKIQWPLQIPSFSTNKYDFSLIPRLHTERFLSKEGLLMSQMCFLEVICIILRYPLSLVRKNILTK